MIRLKLHRDLRWWRRLAKVGRCDTLRISAFLEWLAGRDCRPRTVDMESWTSRAQPKTRGGTETRALGHRQNCAFPLTLRMGVAS